MEPLIYVVPAVIIVVFFLAAAVRILREYERRVVFRLGRLIDARAPASSC